MGMLLSSNSITYGSEDLLNVRILGEWKLDQSMDSLYSIFCLKLLQFYQCKNREPVFMFFFECRLFSWLLLRLYRGS